MLALAAGALGSPAWAQTVPSGTAQTAALGEAAIQRPPGTRRPGPALAPTETTGRAETLADGTSPVSVVIAPRPRPAGLAPAPTDADGAATLLADRVDLTGDRVLTASGGVVVWFEGARLIAERVVYDGNAGTMRIDGPIHLTEPARAGTPDETVLIADAAQMDEGLRDGLLQGARLVLARELQMAAADVQRTGGGRMTTLTHVVASSCQVCAEDPTPLWEIRARRITHDAETRRIQFERAQFRAFGLPVATLPAFSAPDPTADRMTGFLAPRFRTTSNLGFGVMLPYFITLGDSADVTLTPYVSTSRTATLGVRYRQALRTGAVELNGAVSRDDVREKTSGYLFGAAEFRLPHDYRLGLQLQTASNRGYLLDYDITDADRLWSGVTVEKIARDRIVTARIGQYETLRDDEDNATAPSLVADARWERRVRPPVIGGEAGYGLAVHAHQRSSDADILGRDMARVTAHLDWRRSEIMAGGLVATAAARVDADLFRIRSDSRFEATRTRAVPTAAVELRWPLVAQSGGATHLLEPVAQLVWSPRRDETDRIPNEDSTVIEFDEGNLYALNRTPGREAVESGLRANLGVSWTRIDPSGWSLGITAGRVLRAHDDPALRGAGDVLSLKRSDWLLAATYASPGGLAIANRALFDDDLNIHRNEVRLGWLRPDLQISAGYLWIDAATEAGRPRDVSELTATTGWQVAPGWWANAETRYDFIADRAQTAELGMTYRNECVKVDLSISRRFTASDSVDPDTSIGFGVKLGGFGRQDDDLPGTVARRACLR